MKNHIRVNGRLLQTNKKFSALKLRQQEWIASLLRSKTITLILEHKRQLQRPEREQVLQETLIAIEQKGIWIPDCEVRRYFESRIQRYYKSYFKHQALSQDDSPSN
ncbi:hypothetical protein QFZ81_003075 [Paenibacillus sp. V4I9]|uniref:hypothetical protein n=1 Tax=Paenibacillus sp. V4I9 TaxID=3042308 RepID=UPI002788DAB0|nr:hypothetical protein [Paenibacillus sp. V4I9]MDQ0887987.1 hypothetical protein [Paenibacillus sp. V4I9]